MLQSFLRISWRNLLRQKLYSAINILGLTVGMASFLLIILYVKDELSYDRFHPDYEQIYRMSYFRKAQDGTITPFATSGTTWAPRYQELMPEVKDYCLLTHSGYPGYMTREGENEVYMEPDFKWASENFFQFFDFPLIRGRSDQALEHLQSVILSEQSAHKYFGDEDPIGKTLIYNVSGVEAKLLVSGVMKDPPSNTHIKPTFIGNIDYIHQLYVQQYQFDFLNSATDAFAFTYIKISDPSVLPRMRSDWKAYMSEVVAGNANLRPDTYQELKFTPVAQMHFEPEMKWEIDAPANPDYIPLFIIAAILVLIIACINFMNLATARSAKRAKEIGLRKTLGGHRWQLMMQFFGESLMMALVAAILSVGLLWLVLPVFNDLAEKQFGVMDLISSEFLLILFSVTFVVGLFSGSYPALYLSNFDPLSSLRGLFRSGRGAENIRRILVIFQFAVAIILLVGTMVVHGQMQLIHDTKLGQDKDRILSIRLGGFGLDDRFEVFRNTVQQDARFEEISVANHLPRLPHFGLINQQFRLPDVENQTVEWNKFDVDFDFARTFDLEIIAGRDFDRMVLSDSNAIILNEAAVNALNLAPSDVVGLTIVDRVFNQQLQQQTDLTGQVIGVVKDFPYKSVNTTIEPLAIWGTPSPIDRICYIKITPGNLNEKIRFLNEQWRSLIPGLPMESWFMDFEFGRLYENERRMSKIFNLFAGITIFIAVLGLFALTSYTTEQRKKEIGVRKVLGASELSLMKLLLVYFGKLILIGYLMAIPISYFLMDRWLDTFVYRVEISLIIVGLAALIVAAITFVTVAWDTYRAAVANPVQTLRVE